MLSKGEQKLILLMSDDPSTKKYIGGYSCFGYDYLFRSGIFKSKKLITALSNLEKYGLIKKFGIYRSPRSVRRMTKRQLWDYKERVPEVVFSNKGRYRSNKENDRIFERAWNNSKFVELTKDGRKLGRVLTAMVMKKENINEEQIIEKYFPGIIEKDVV